MRTYLETKISVAPGIIKKNTMGWGGGGWKKNQDLLRNEAIKGRSVGVRMGLCGCRDEGAIFNLAYNILCS